MAQTFRIPHKSIQKQLKLKEITILLKSHGPLPATEIMRLMKGLKFNVAGSYLRELAAGGYIRKVLGKEGKKSIPAYQYQIEYGAKTDIVSAALSHPLHQLTLSIVKYKPKNLEEAKRKE